MKRSLSNIPEGGCHIEDVGRFIFANDPDAHIKLGEGVTREWSVSYFNKGETKLEIFIVHGDTAQGAFEHFCNLFPHTEIKAFEFMGVYW